MNRRNEESYLCRNELEQSLLWDKEEIEYLLKSEKKLGIVKHIIKLLSDDEIINNFPRDYKYIFQFKQNIANWGQMYFHLKKIKRIFLSNINAILNSIKTN